MSERFFPIRFDKMFPTEAEALHHIERDITATDESRPVEKRFELKLFHAAQAVVLSDRKKLLVVGETHYLLATTKNGAVAVYMGNTGLAYETLEEAQSWVQEFADMGASGEWVISRH